MTIYKNLMLIDINWINEMILSYESQYEIAETLIEQNEAWSKKLFFEQLKSQLIPIDDIRLLLLKHPNQEMIRECCLHYLGDKFQKFEQLNK